MSKPVTYEKSKLLALLGLPFFLVGAGFLVMSVIPTCYDAWRMASWQETQVQLSDARLESHRGSKGGTSYSVAASYSYEVKGLTLHNNRVSITSGADNIGDFQQDLAQSLQQSWQSGQKVSVWYDPDNPQDAILNRDIRWGLLAIKSIFVVVFGGIGTALMFYGLRGVPPTPKISGITAAKSWLNNPDWQDGVIRYKGKAKVYFAWVFVLIVCPASTLILLNFLEKNNKATIWYG